MCLIGLNIIIQWKCFFLSNYPIKMLNHHYLPSLLLLERKKLRIKTCRMCSLLYVHDFKKFTPRPKIIFEPYQLLRALLMRVSTDWNFKNTMCMYMCIYIYIIYVYNCGFHNITENPTQNFLKENLL